MSAGRDLLPAGWALTLVLLVILGYYCYQLLGFQVLCGRYRRLLQ